MKCPECNEYNLVPGAKYCKHCGAPLSANGVKIVNNRKKNVVPSLNRGWNISNISPTITNNELQKLQKKLTVTTIIILSIALFLIYVRIWPGCLICIPLFLLSVVTGFASIYFAFPNDHLKGTLGGGDNTRLQNLCKTFDHSLNMLLIWSTFWLIVGLFCMFTIGWWAVLICGVLNILALIVTVTIIIGVTE